MMPNYSAVSEPWMRRMLLGIRKEVAAVAAVGIPSIDEALADIPHFELARTRRGRRVIELFARTWLYRHKALRSFIEEKRITHVLCHFGTLAMDYDDVFDSIDASVFVHFHGFDATFDLCDYSGNSLHSPTYKQRVVELSKSARFIANSEYTKSLLCDAGVDENRVAVKYLGVKPADEFRRREHEGALQVLFVGRLVDFKAPELAMKAFDAAVGQGLDADFTIVGDGPLRNSITQLRESLQSRERIHIAGALPWTEVQRYLRQTDLYLQHNVIGPQTHQPEAYGVSILEAMAEGIPVVVTRSGGVPAVLGPEIARLATEPGDIEAQTARLIELGSSPSLRESFGRECWQWVRDNRTLDQEAENLISIMEQPDA